MLTLLLPLVAGLSASHGLVAPHPGPLVAIARLEADTGLSILYGIAAGIPACLVAGPLFVRMLPPPMMRLGTPMVVPAPPSDAAPPPGVAVTLATVLLPIALMLGATTVTAMAGRAPGGAAGPVLGVVAFLGQPAVALLVGTLAATEIFGRRRGLTGAALLGIAERSLFPIASVLLIVGAGGGFGRVLDQAGIGNAITSAVSSLSLSPIVFGWLVAALLRIAVALGAGSLIASHVNDGGFWLVKEYLGLDVPTMLKTWTVIETIISVVALGVVLLLDVAL
jgi:GntP family gluconate:H+ symporter